MKVCLDQTYLQWTAIYSNRMLKNIRLKKKHLKHGLRTPNEGINQRYLKNWADVADKICFGRT